VQWRTALSSAVNALLRRNTVLALALAGREVSQAEALMPADPPSGLAGVGEPEPAITRQANLPYGDSGPPAALPLDAQHGIAFEGQATDPTETLRASREVPEPDSLGG
jgi:hypothetical protein